MIVSDVDHPLGMGSLWIDEKGVPEGLYWAGGVDIVVDGYARVVFCVDLLTSVNVPGTYDTTMDFSDTPYISPGNYSDVPSLKRVGWLLQNEWPSTALDGAALQLAIWGIITDKGDGFGTADAPAGIVSQSTDASHPTDSSVLAAAILYETESAGMSSSFGIVYHNTTLDGVPVQTLMGPGTDDGGPSPAPEPATVLMIFGGLALIGVSRLRRSARTN